MSDKIRQLYWEKNLSTYDIGKILKVSQWKVIALMRKYNIPRRKACETLEIKFRKSALSYNPKLELTLSEKLLHDVGLMLYWAEGAKARRGIVDFSNCNEQMILIFLQMLRKIYRVREKRIHVFLYCHANQKIPVLIDYWSKILNIPASQFSKPYMRNTFDPLKKDKMPHGLAHIRYNDLRLHEQILKDIAIIALSLLPRWQSSQMHGTVNPAPERAT